MGTFIYQQKVYFCTSSLQFIFIQYLPELVSGNICRTPEYCSAAKTGLRFSTQGYLGIPFFKGKPWIGNWMMSLTQLVFL